MLIGADSYGQSDVLLCMFFRRAAVLYPIQVTALGNHTVLDTLSASFGGRAVRVAASGPQAESQAAGSQPANPASPQLRKTHRTQGVSTAGYRTLYPESIALIASLVVEETRLINPTT